jgi:tetratricopeptide (TPR) repeat protein
VFPDSPREVLARLLHAEGLLTSERGALGDAVDLLSEAALLFRALGDRTALGRVLVTLSNVEQTLGRLDDAARTAAEAVDLAHDLGDLRSEASATGNIALIALKQGRMEDAQAGISRAVEMFRRAGDMRAVAIGLGNLGAIAGQGGDFDRAAELHREALAAAASLNSLDLEGWARTNLAGALSRRGDWADAAPLAVEGIRQQVAAEAELDVVQALGLAAAILVAAGDTRTAITAWSAAEANAERLEISLERDETDETDIQRVRDATKPTDWDECARIGAALDYKEAADLVLGRLRALDLTTQ